MLIYWVRGWELLLESDTGQTKRGQERQKKKNMGGWVGGGGREVACCLQCLKLLAALPTFHSDWPGEQVWRCGGWGDCTETTLFHILHIPTLPVFMFTAELHQCVLYWQNRQEECDWNQDGFWQRLQHILDYIQKTPWNEAVKFCTTCKVIIYLLITTHLRATALIKYLLFSFSDVVKT